MGAGSVTVVVPSAVSPASSSADFTCALATGSVYSMPWSAAPPVIVTGGLPPTVATCAPMSRSGAATRSMGRFMSEESPMSLESKRCAASRPMNRRMAVPALPMFSSDAAAFRPCIPAPWTITLVVAGRSIAMPIACSAVIVERQSSLARKPLTRVTPCARPPSMSERCEIDLSPGTVSSPPTRVTGCAR